MITQNPLDMLLLAAHAASGLGVILFGSTAFLVAAAAAVVRVKAVPAATSEYSRLSRQSLAGLLVGIAAASAAVAIIFAAVLATAVHS